MPITANCQTMYYTDNAALSIKSYLKFCHDMDVPHWRPDQTDIAEIKGEILSEEITYEDAEDFDIVDVKTEPTMFDGKVFSIQYRLYYIAEK